MRGGMRMSQVDIQEELQQETFCIMNEKLNGLLKLEENSS